MSNGYHVPPAIPGAKAFTFKGVLTVILAICLYVGLIAASERYGFENWLKALVQLIFLGVGLNFAWAGVRSWQTDEPLANDDELPRYSEPSFGFISPRALAVGEIALGALIAAGAAFQLYEILSE